MADFGKRLKDLRTENGYSLNNLAKTYNDRFDGRLNKSTISRYENGLQEPIITVVSNFAKLFNVSSDYLLGNVSEPFFHLDNARILREVNARGPEDNSDDYSLVTIHYAGPVAAHFDATPDDAYELRTIPAEWIGRRRPEDFFLATISGDSMYPQFQDGDDILCLSCSDMEVPGRIGIILLGDGEATVKKINYKPGEDWLELVPINPEFKPKRIEGSDLEKCRVVGRVIKVIRTVDQI